jgi:hypothetical protein
LDLQEARHRLSAVNERSDGVNRVSLPSNIIAFVVFCRLRYRVILRRPGYVEAW